MFALVYNYGDGCTFHADRMFIKAFENKLAAMYVCEELNKQLHSNDNMDFEVIPLEPDTCNMDDRDDLNKIIAELEDQYVRGL